VVLPSGGGLPALNAAAVWWRVDPRTGETLAIGSDGRGPTATEYVIKKALMGLTCLTAFVIAPTTYQS